MKFDLHMHTVYSDGRSSVNDVIEVAKQKNIGVAITDHNHIKGSILGYELADKDNIPFICGMELGTNEGKELLLYFKSPQSAENFFKKEVEPFRSNRMTRINRPMTWLVGSMAKDIKKEYEIFFSTIPHPFGVLYKNIHTNPDISNLMLDFANALEAINATMSEAKNMQAFALAKKLGKLCTASTDAHIKRLIGNLTTDILFDELGNISHTDISHNKYLDSSFDIAQTLMQITKCNIAHSILKIGKSRE